MSSRLILIAAFALLAALAARSAQSADAPAAPRTAEQCKALADADFLTVQDAPAQITFTQQAAASNDMPAYCQVKGYVVPHVGFELRLPASTWNGKFLQVGCGGTCGKINIEDCAFALRRGYACLATDMGHTGTAFQSAWAYNNLQGEVDFAYRATHVAALAGKAITESHYQKAPQRSYFMGCSQGGRQGLVEAQRFPWDFDGIVAGSPVIHYAVGSVHLLSSPNLMQTETGAPLLSAQAVTQLHQAVLRQCDRDDGLADGVISDPRACQFDPEKMACSAVNSDGCLTVAQANAVKSLYAGPTLPSGEKLFWGVSRGSELSWPGSFISMNGEPSFLQKFAVEKFKYLTFMPDPGPSWQAADFDLARDYRRFGLTEALFSGANPDLRQFKAVGGKLMIYQGWNDVLASLPESIIDYYETMERTMGGRAATQEFARLFMLPGVTHCGGGEGADTIDYLTYLESWVEQGQAPDRMIAAHLNHKSGTMLHHSFPLDRKNVAFTRPAYPYPRRAVYNGSGDPKDAVNFRASEESSERK